MVLACFLDELINKGSRGLNIKKFHFRLVPLKKKKKEEQQSYREF